MHKTASAQFIVIAACGGDVFITDNNKQKDGGENMKTYVKPKIDLIQIEANQAIASCGTIITGYDNSFARGLAGQFGHSTKESAWKAYDQYNSYEYSESYDPMNQSPFIFPVVYCETKGVNGQLAYGTFHDINGNGIMDNGEYFAWQQNDYNSLLTVANGENLAIVAS